MSLTVGVRLKGDDMGKEMFGSSETSGQTVLGFRGFGFRVWGLGFRVSEGCVHHAMHWIRNQGP